MARFEELQELWQGQAAPAVDAEDILRLTRSLHAYGRRQNYINTGKALLVTAILGWSASRVWSRPLALWGFVVIGVTATFMIVRDWRNQRAIAGSDLSAPSVEFIRERIARLEEQRDPYRRHYWALMGAVILGMNLQFQHSPPLWIRAVFSVLPLLGFEAGMWVRRKRFELECRPLIAQLSAMQRALEERSE